MDRGVEMEFSDGKFVVDTPLAAVIRRATDGHPEKFTFRDAQALIGPQMAGDVFRNAISRVKADHLRTFGD